MATRVIKLREAEEPAPETVQEVLSQSKRPEVGRFLLQVDRQTKQSYATAEAAEMAGMVIKKGHPIVRVSVYDSVETANKIIELPAGSSVARAMPLIGWLGSFSAGLSDARGIVLSADKRPAAAHHISNSMPISITCALGILK
jgi:hypothetical protein